MPRKPLDHQHSCSGVSILAHRRVRRLRRLDHSLITCHDIRLAEAKASGPNVIETGHRVSVLVSVLTPLLERQRHIELQEAAHRRGSKHLVARSDVAFDTAAEVAGHGARWLGHVRQAVADAAAVVERRIGDRILVPQDQQPGNRQRYAVRELGVVRDQERDRDIERDAVELFAITDGEPGPRRDAAAVDAGVAELQDI